MALVPLLQGPNPVVKELMAFLEEAQYEGSESSEADLRPNGTVSDRAATYIGGAVIPRLSRTSFLGR